MPPLPRTRQDRSGKHLLCGYPRCAVLGDTARIVSGVLWVSLLEGFHEESDGVFGLHPHAQKRYDRGLEPKDAHGRWVGWVPIAGKQDSWRWEAGGNSIPGAPERERLPYRERALAESKVRCPRCKRVSVVAFDTAQEAPVE